MPGDVHRRRGDVVVLRYVTTDGRIELAWPCRVVDDAEDVLALFIARGSRYKTGPKRTAAQKLTDEPRPVPVDERLWKHDTLRLMFPEACHSVWLFWDGQGASQRLLRYFVNLEEPFRRTPIGFDTQDHTLDIVATPELECRWRDEEEFDRHIALGFYTPALAATVRAEGERVIEALARGTHPCLDGWADWTPDRQWSPPSILAGWNTTPTTSWPLKEWAYGVRA